MNREASTGVRNYETSQLIPYLGNKRALVPRLRELFLTLGPAPADCVFLDPFAGAGSVSRLARSLGMRVRANDWEPYSYVLNRSWLTLKSSDLARLFRKEGGLAKELSRLNSFHPSRDDNSPSPAPEPFMARWYAPRDTLAADWRTERLFYTRENAVFLDRVREDIARRRRLSEADPCDDPDVAGPWLLLALLVLEAATHANTSGVFKAFHKGFGGHGKDALPRILGAMELEFPILPEADRAVVLREDASRFVRRFPADIAYLDPPYNQHQYGSNYHLLNTLVRWDREPVSLETGRDGRLVRKAGIPAIWKSTRSAYCGRRTARDALISLLDNLDARTVVLSYNTEGIVPPEELRDILSSRWEVRAEVLDYVRYRGGRQSSAREVRNHELVYVGEPRPTARRSVALRDPGGLAAELRLRRLLSSRFDPEKIASRFRLAGDSVHLGEGLGTWRMWRFYRFVESRDSALRPPDPSWNQALSLLESCEIRSNGEAVRVLVRIAEDCLRNGSSNEIPDARKASLEALSALRKLAHPKYIDEYTAAERLLSELTEKNPFLKDRLDTGLERLRAVRTARLEGARKKRAEVD